MIPIAKNINVVDEFGKKYEATYLNRAKGLVKNGRARFIDENTICLACPPTNILEDKNMTDNNFESKNASVQDAVANVLNSKANKTKEENSETSQKLTMEYLLQKIEEISKDQPYISEAIAALEHVKSGGPGDVGVQAQAHAFCEIVKAREATNQKLLSLYEKMYEDLKPLSESFQIARFAKLKELFSTKAFETLFSDCDSEQANYIIDSIRQILAGR